MALNSLICADVPLSNYSLTHLPYFSLPQVSNNNCLTALAIAEKAKAGLAHSNCE